MSAFSPFRQLGTRRNFIRVGTAGLTGLTLPAFLRQRAAAADAPTPPARSLILIWLSGGPSTIDMWDMKPGAPELVRGEFSPIDTAVPGVQICEHLPYTAKILDRCVLLRSLQHSIVAHEPGTQLMMTGHIPAAAVVHPSLGSLCSRLLPGDAAIPRYVTFGDPASRGAGYLGAACNPFEVKSGYERIPRGVALPPGSSIAEFDERIALRNAFDARLSSRSGDRIADGLDQFEEQAVSLLRSNRIGSAFDVELEAPEVRARYGRGYGLATNMLRARRLIEAGARFVTVGADGWDTHVGNFATLRNTRLPELDQALSALISDLAERNLLSETLVCCGGEFGRTPQVNGNRGRDHWSRAMSMLLAGGGLVAGSVVGATDKQGGEPIDAACTPADLCATLLQQLGIDPQGTIFTPEGRPMPVIRDGRILRDLLA